jgi:hypothetical protein
MPSTLDELLGPPTLLVDGVEQVTRKLWEFEGATLSDNPTTGVKTITITGLAPNMANNTPPAVGAAGAVGASEEAAREDHTHAHGDQTVTTLHAAATASLAGFATAAQITKLDGIDPGAQLVRRVDYAGEIPSYTRTGNTITAFANGAFALDGAAPSEGDTILYCNLGEVDIGEADDYGWWTVSDAGDGGSPFILTRTTGATTSAEVKKGQLTIVSGGTDNADSIWGLFTEAAITLNTTELDFRCVGRGDAVAGGPFDSATETGVVYVRPIDGVSDDWPALEAVLIANAYQNKVVMLPGLAGEDWICDTTIDIPNGSHIVGTPNTRIVCTLATGVSSAPFRKVLFTTTTVYTLSANVAVGATSLSVSASIPAGSRVCLADAATGHVGAIYTTGTPSGVGPYTIPIDRPTHYAYPSASSTLELVTAQTQDIHIEGNGMTVTGTADCYVDLSAALHCSLSGITADSSGGAISAAGIVFLFDSYSFQCEMVGLRSTSAALVGGFFATCEQCTMRDCHFDNCTTQGINFQGSADCLADNCRAHKGTANGFLFGTANGTVGCVACRVVGGSYNGNAVGIAVTVGATGCSVTGVTCWGNSQKGIFIDATTTVPVNTRITNVSCQYGGDMGIDIAAGCKGTVVDTADVSNNVATGLRNGESATLRNITWRGNLNGSGGVIGYLQTAGADVHIDGFDFQSSLSGVIAAPFVIQGGVLSMRAGHSTLDDAITFPKHIAVSGSNTVLKIEDVRLDGAAGPTNLTGMFCSTASNTIRIGSGFDPGNCAIATDLTNCAVSHGQITANGAGTAQDVTWPNLKSHDRVTLELVTPGGTPGVNRVQYTLATKFTVTFASGDTSVYNYVVS